MNSSLAQVTNVFQDCNIDVQGLIENKEYTFRVAACNENGQGEWIEAESPIVAKLPFGMKVYFI